jgi:Zn-finger nucleic acid-binding protein
MNCPACGKALSEIQQSDLTVDICRNGCGGLWFDNFELKKVDEAHESAGEALLNVQAPAPVASQKGTKRSCPRCQNVKMMQHFFSVRKEIEVDTCGGCAGVWLDTNELGSIRRQFKTEAERKQAFEDHFKDLFGAELAKAVAEREQRSEKAQNIARAIKFLLPSYWIPGKQPWGAF